ncbi:MAG TPA: AMP-binding protein [Candidatus Limnocylindria bacterium]|nr:AMP-binding protein [Candidatus Limnocylindria bacterium]
MPYRSPYPDVAIPALTLDRFLLAGAAARGARPALVDGPSGRVLAYGELAERVERMAGGLAARGLGAGDIVGLIAPNRPEYAVAFLAIARLGAVVTPIPSVAAADEIARQLAGSGARAIVADAGFLDRAWPAAARAGVTHRFVIGPVDGEVTLDDLARTDAPVAPVVAGPDDVLALPWSSGTTGMPKGVLLTHRNVVANVVQVAAGLEVGPDERLIGVLPFFHIYGMTVVMSLALARGASVVTMPRWDLDQFLDLVERHRITRAMLVPPIVLALARDPRVDGRDLSSIRFIKSGAAPLDAALAREAAARIGATIVQGYGMTEASPVTHLTPDREGMRDPGSIGPLVPGTEARIVDLVSGDDLPPGREGELWVRGPQVMRGYRDDPVATAATLDADGWLHTGDVARVDEAGWFTIVDRVKELIKVRGHGVAPAELEALLVSHPAVADAAVIGVPDEDAGERPGAFVVLRGAAGEREIRDWVAERVAPYKRLASVRVVDAIPRSASGKILRRELREGRSPG